MHPLLLEKFLANKSVINAFGNCTLVQIEKDAIRETCVILSRELQLPFKFVSALDTTTTGESTTLLYLFGVPSEHMFVGVLVDLHEIKEFPSIIDIVPAAAGYERRIKELFGCTPVGHVDTRPNLLHENWPTDCFPLRKNFPWQQRPEKAENVYAFQKVEGEGIYEIPVGPVHAGIIEPGHFRFSVAGEEILLLEPRLGYKHKGIEKLFEVLSLEKKIQLAERVSGDTSFTHALAFCQAIESLSQIEIPSRAQFLRVIYSELERLANHCNDIGFIMLDTGYAFGGSNGARLREMIMRWNERLTGSRFLRGVNTVGGVQRDISPEIQPELFAELQFIEKDFSQVIAIALENSTIYNRLKDTGVLDMQTARDLAVVGVAGRASGMVTDARKDFPYAAYRELPFDVAHEQDGDVNARFHVRIQEVHSSLQIIREACDRLEPGPIVTEKQMDFPKNSFSIGVTEGWRGEIIYVVATDDDAQITRVIVRDPSVPNWPAAGYAGKGNVVPDFPLINKSFNLSYSGNDL